MSEKMSEGVDSIVKASSGVGVSKSEDLQVSESDTILKLQEVPQKLDSPAPVVEKEDTQNPEPQAQQEEISEIQVPSEPQNDAYLTP